MSGTYLDHHHKVLKQFLDVSDDQSSRNKPLSTRAARAREKLLNLSEAQFRELSTDVYDELKRRIDESRRDPGYLLPEASFHPKRNQAREKLSSLPQNRFKGLVSDVSYEIERRGLHIVPEPEPEPVPEVNVDSQPDGTNDDEPYHEKSLGGHATLDDVDTAPTNEVDINNSQTSPTSELPNQTIGISSKTVVPTKANLTWSSEEEDNGIEEIDDQDLDREKSRAIDTDATHSGSIISPSIAEKNSMLENLKHELHLKSTENDQLKLDLETMQKNLDTEVDKNLKLSQDLESLHHDKQLSHDNVAKHQDNYDKLVKEFENVKATNAQLRLENQSLKNSVPRDNKSINNGLSKDLSDSNHNVGGTALGVAAGAAVGAAGGAAGTRAMGAANTKEATNRVASSSNSNELNLILQKLSALDEPPAEKKSSFSQLKNEVIKWQKKYEDLRTSKNYTVFTKQNNLTDHQIQSLISNSGLISINLINQFQSLIETFLILIDDKQANSDIIFEKVSQISIISNEIANESESHQLSKNEYSINVRDVTSHLLTVTRYYTLYSNIIPKFIIERSINELIFSICELVGYAKINNNAGEIQSNVKSNTVFNNNTNVNNSNGSLVSGSNRQLNNSSNTNVLDDETNLGVRPLRMANKLRSNNASNLSLDSDHNTKELNTAINNNNNMDHGNISNGISYASANTSKISDATSKFERLTDEINVSTDKISTSSPKTTPTKKNNILDKVKQFESPPSEDFKKNFNNSPESTSNSSSFILNRSSLKIKKSPVINKYDDRSGDVSNKSIDTSAINNGSANVAGFGNRTVSGAAAAAATAAVGTAAIGTAAAASTNSSKKGIFQSIRDRFNGDEESDGRQDTSNDNFNTTAETTPSKDSINEELESPSKPFIPVKDRIERAPSTNSDATIKGEQLSNGSIIDNKPQHLNDVDIADNIKNEEKTEIKEKRESRELISKSRDSIKASKGLIAESKQLLNESKQGINESKEEPKSKKVNFSNSDENIDSLNSLNGVNQSNGANNKKSVKIFSEPEVIDKENSSPSKGNQPEEEDEDAEEDEKTVKARQRQEYRKSMAAATFNIDLFDIDDPDNTLTQVLLYLEHQTVEVIATIQMLLSTIKKPNATRGDLREKSKAITEVISQMTEATNTSMNQTRNFQLKEHGNWVVKSLEDCYHRMSILCKPSNDKKNLDQEFADRSFKQRLAGISFDIAKCTKELVKTVEEASLKEDIANLDARLSNDDLL